MRWQAVHFETRPQGLHGLLAPFCRSERAEISSALKTAVPQHVTCKRCRAKLEKLKIALDRVR